MSKKKKKSPWVALLIGAGVLGYLFLTKKSSTSTAVDVPTDVSDGSEPSPPPPAPPVYQSGLDPTLIDLTLQNQLNTDLRTAYNTIYQLPGALFAKIQPTAYTLEQHGKLTELQAIADYITNFLTKGIPLTRTAENAALYDQIMAIHATYGIF